jgi:hypothetical protein
MTRLCPYCDERACDSDDHVFSQFLGGTATIKSCKRCNDSFGHSFEGPLSHDLAPLIVMLRRCGLRSPRRVVWRRAIKYGKTQADYDLDSDLTLTPSAPIFEEDQGAPKRITAASQRQLNQLSKLLEKGGKKTRMRSELKTGIDIQEFSFRIEIGHEARRLALKTAVAVANKAFGWSNMLDPHARGYLLGELSESLIRSGRFPKPPADRSTASASVALSVREGKRPNWSVLCGGQALWLHRTLRDPERQDLRR